MVMATCKMKKNEQQQQQKARRRTSTLDSVGGAVLCGLGIFCCLDLVIPCGSRSSLSGSHNLTSRLLALPFKVHPNMGLSLVSLHSMVMWSHRNIFSINEGSS